MKPAPFTYHRPETLAEAVRLLAELAPQDGRVLAGGQSLVPIMAFRLARPAHLIDINGLGLDKIEPTPEGGLRIGALVRNTDLAAHETVRRDYGLLSRALVAGASGPKSPPRLIAE